MTKRTGGGTPPSPAYFWLLNGRMTAAKIRRDLRRMASDGVRAVCPHPWPRCFRPDTMPSAMAPDYLSPGYFRLFRLIVEECRRLGLVCWLYDEGGWPSGNAAGQVRLASPEAFAPQAVGPEGQPRKMPLPAAGEIPPADALNPEATAKFIELTHERYLGTLGGEMGGTLFAAFTDEPHFTETRYGKQLPWCENFDGIFLKRKKYDVRPFLARLFAPPREEDPPALVRARIDFHDVFSQLFVENYFLPIRDFCRKHGILSGGHLNADDSPPGTVSSGSGHIMRALRAMDLPGVDVIARQIAPGRAVLPFTKFASSVARQAGRKWTAAEVFAVYGCGISPVEQKFVIDTVAADGASVFILSGYAMSHKNMVSHLRPHFDGADPLESYADLRSGYISRLGCWLTRGAPCVPVLVYYDQRSIWAGAGRAVRAAARLRELCSEVFSRGSDLDFADDDALCKAVRKGEKIRVGRMCYSHLLLPEENCLAPEAAARLVKEGITPSPPSAPRPLLAVAPADGIRIVKRQWGKREIFFLLNTSCEEKRVEIIPPGGRALVRVDAAENTFSRLPVNGRGRAELCFPPFGSVLLVTGIAAKPEVLPAGGGEIPLRLERMTVLRQVFCDAEDFRWSRRRRALPGAAWGDWRRWAGEDFSGEIRYRCTFDLDGAAKRLHLSLGEVRYAVRVRLNGRVVGRKLFPPFDFVLSSGLKKGRNRLEIDVTNTLANALLGQACADAWARAGVKVSPYEERQRAFEKESLPSGLIGPVTLKLFSV
ncbi:MAG: hypothetical protein IJS01_08755 [Lentisphaeria bacterium]|nr:hypothetical protein [Lentisphaeria bacterium]